jgi:hypothetical protein
MIATNRNYGHYVFGVYLKPRGAMAMKELVILVLGVVVAMLTVASTQVVGQKMSDRDVERIQMIEDQIAKERNAEWEKQHPEKSAP